MGIIDLFRKKREEDKERSRDLEDYKQKLILEMKLRGERPHLNKIPEEIELEGYLEENRRNKIKELVFKERLKRSLFGYAGNQFDVTKPKSNSKFKAKKYNLGKIAW